MCFESGGLCLAIEPCGDSPMVVFISVDKNALLPYPCALPGTFCEYELQTRGAGERKS